MKGLGGQCRALGIAVLCALGAPVAANPFDADLSGTWRGKGTLAPGVDAPERRGRCKVDVAARPGAEEFGIEGICAVAAGQQSFALRVIRIDDTRLRAGFRSPGFDSVAQYAGTIEEARIALASISVFQIDGARYRSRMTIDFQSDDMFSMTEWVRPEGSGPERRVAALVFERSAPAN